MNPSDDPRLRVAAISFLNTAPLMWDFTHSPLQDALEERYRVNWMLPSACADQLASEQAEVGLVPIAALAANPTLRILPGCTIASRRKVRSLLLVHRAAQPIESLLSVAADTASRSTLAYSRILLSEWGNPAVPFVPMRAELDTMLDQADAAILIGDPALLALEERLNRQERTGEELVYLDLAEEWNKLTGMPYVAALWCLGLADGNRAARVAHGSPLVESVAQDFTRSRDHGLQNLDTLAAEWSSRIALPSGAIRRYLAENIHYTLDHECVEAMRLFFRMAARCGALPEFAGTLDGLL